MKLVVARSRIPMPSGFLVVMDIFLNLSVANTQTMATYNAGRSNIGLIVEFYSGSRAINRGTPQRRSKTLSPKAQHIVRFRLLQRGAAQRPAPFFIKSHERVHGKAARCPDRSRKGKLTLACSKY